MDKLIRFLPLLPGALMLVNGIGFIAQPEQAASSLGMPYLEGMGRSTQVGDFAAFFVSCAAMCGLGVWKRRATWLYGAAMLLGSAAVFRTVSTVLHDAPFATQFIVFEGVFAALLIWCAGRYSKLQ